MRRLLYALIPALLLTLTACDPKNTGLMPDSITINVTGLPNELQPDIAITGPNGYEQTITETATLGELAAGQYTVTVNSVEFRGNRFDPDQATHQLGLAAGDTQSARVIYAPHREVSKTALSRLNQYRTAAGQPAATMDSNGSLPNWLHSRYLALNGVTGHDEDPLLPWYTPEGRQAGLSSNVMRTGRDLRDDLTYMVDGFAQAPFHFFNLLDPRTTTVRLGYYFRNFDGCDADPCYGTTGAATFEPIRSGTWPANTVVRFPADEQTIDQLAHKGESPSPLAACPDYSAPAGLPLFVMHGRDNLPQVRTTTLTLAGVPVEHCAFVENTYVNPDPAAQALARNILRGHGALVIVPREPLQPNATYHVTVEYETGIDEWSFHTTSAIPSSLVYPADIEAIR